MAGVARQNDSSIRCRPTIHKYSQFIVEPPNSRWPRWPTLEPDTPASIALVCRPAIASSSSRRTSIDRAARTHASGISQRERLPMPASADARTAVDAQTTYRRCRRCRAPLVNCSRVSTTATRRRVTQLFRASTTTLRTGRLERQRHWRPTGRRRRTSSFALWAQDRALKLRWSSSRRSSEEMRARRRHARAKSLN